VILVKQVNDVEHQRYDVVTMVSAYRPEYSVPSELAKFTEQFPGFFLKVPAAPLNKTEGHRR
jgi:hypothetical protein